MNKKIIKKNGRKSEAESLAELVDRIMTEEKLSSYEVAARSGNLIDQTGVSRIRKGRTKYPSPPKQKALAEGLSIPAEMIADAVNQIKNGASPFAKEVVNYLNEIPEERQKDILLIAKAFYRKYK